MPRSLQGRLLLLVIGTVLVLWAAAGLVVWQGARARLDDLLDGHLAQAAAILVVQQGNEISDDDFDIDAPMLHHLAPKVAFQVLHEGALVMRSDKAPREPFVPATSEGVSGFRDVAVTGVAWRVFGAVGNEHQVQVYVAERIDSRQAILWAVLRGMLGPALAAIPLLALATAWSVHHCIEPLRQLGRLLAARRPQAEDALVVASAPTELAPVIAALDGLFTRTRVLLGAERRFTADAAHELRTPIAAIRAQAQAALGEHDEAVRRRALEATLEGCDRASHLVAQMLTLSRVEAEAHPPGETVDLVPLVRRVLAEIAPEALLKDHSIELEAGEALTVPGDATLLAILVRNLADNAIRYSPAGATIRVRLERHGEYPRMRVEDSGPGLSDSQRARFGERFFRVPGSGQEGSGLGGSIVARIAAVHGAHLAARPSADLGGLCVEVDWSPPGGSRAALS